MSNIETPPVPALPAEAEVVHNETTNEEIEAQLADVRSGYGDAVQTHDGLDQLGITELRKLSRGVFTGGYDLKKTELIEQLRAHGVHV